MGVLAIVAIVAILFGASFYIMKYPPSWFTKNNTDENELDTFLKLYNNALADGLEWVGENKGDFRKYLLAAWYFTAGYRTSIVPESITKIFSQQFDKFPVALKKEAYDAYMATEDTIIEKGTIELLATIRRLEIDEEYLDILLKVLKKRLVKETI